MSTFTGLGSALRVLRQRRGLPQYETAQRAGVTKAMLSAYEVGKQHPTLTTLERVLDAMDASLPELARELQMVAEAAQDAGVELSSRHSPLRLHSDDHPSESGPGSTGTGSGEMGPLRASVDRILLAILEARLDEIRAVLRRELGG